MTLTFSIPQMIQCGPALKIAWCRDVFVLVDRASGGLAATDPPVGPVTLIDTALDRLAYTAIPIVLQTPGKC